MLSTMPDYPLSLRHIFEHGRDNYPDSEIVTATADGHRRISFADLAKRVGQLANALAKAGVTPGDRVATFAWNNQEHQEAYLAVPCSGAVLHTVNIRLAPADIAFIMNHAEDKILLLDAALAEHIAPALPEVTTLELIVVFGEGDRSVLSAKAPIVEYEEFIAAESQEYEWPDLDENSAAAMCYTSGTAGKPKGVVYSHRSTYIFTLGMASGESLKMDYNDRVLPYVPMFHGNAWGLPYLCWMVGADLYLPAHYANAERIARTITDFRITVAGAVPTVWWDVIHLEDDSIDLSSLRMILCGGAATPRSLIEEYRDKYGINFAAGWGLTETHPIASLAFPPRDASPDEALDYEATAGQMLAGVEVRIVDPDNNVLPWDGESVGEIEVRGPWVTTSYYRDPAEDKFHDGWLRTGDVGCLDRRGYLRITDRAKDVVKSGGEWISSLELESLLTKHPQVKEVAVIAAPDERWGERPLACVVLKEGAEVTGDELKQFLAGKVEKWWLPDLWTFVENVPRTGVGKHDKKFLRDQLAGGELNVERSGKPQSGANPR
ncbi:MAG: long-chain fatty acid--CoA ligase [Micrococcales bacterium]|nr:MAG: long-chain fatty acid--CoA ligase [Micrococcales bacterium]PIE27751.1 MAG: long-chain fatty acid--CoA ligase [Micrococcales bacterium]